MRSKLLAPVLFGCFVTSFWASSARAEEPVTTETSTGRVQPSLSSNAIHLDLTSVDRTATAGHLAAEGLEILVGETVRQLSSTSMLTPAEKLAAYQVFSERTQTIILGAQGNAIGGTFTMGERFTNYVSGLVIPEGVLASRDFGTASALQLTGPLVNAGTLMATSSNAAATAALISASSIVNQSTGLIASMAGTANGVGLDLHLTARGDIINFGTIASAGNLSLSAGGAIVNGSTTTPAVASIISAMSSAMPTLLANGNLVLNSSSIVNSGLIESLNGNIQSALSTTQVLSRDTGLMQALQGTINLGTASVLSNSALNVLGGTFRATDIDLIAGGGNGKLRVEVEQLDGTVHTAGSYARVGVREGALLLGNIQIAGDPTYFNSAVNGDIQISGNISVEEALSIIASRNITTTAAATLIQARSAAGQGFDINFLAGANITTGAGSTSSINTTPPIVGSAISPVTINGASATGGNVDFTASPLLSINASSTCANCSGGNVVIAAYANGAGSGFIKLPPQTSPTQLGSTVNASGFGTGNNGSVTMLAGGTVGETIQTGAVFTRLGTGGLNGNISLATAQPVTSDGNALVFGTDGRISSGNFLRAGATQAGASININNNLIASGLVDIQAGAHITTTPGVVATVPVGPSSSFGAGFKFLGQGVAINNAGSTAYVANLLDNSITVIRTSDNVVTDTIQLGPPNPGGIFITAAVLEGLEVTPDDKYLIASSIFGDNALGALYVIDTTNNTVVNQIDSDVFHLYPACVTIDSTGKYAYVSNEGLFDPSVLVAASNLSVIDIDAAINNPGSALVSTVDLGVDPFQSTLTPDGRFLYTLNALGSLPPTISAPTVSVIDTQLALTDPANAVVATITLPSLPTVEFGALSIAMHPSGNRVYVSNADTNSLQVIDTATNQIVGNVGVGTQPGGVAIERGGTFLFSMNSNASNGYSTLANGSMSIVRTGDNTTVAEVPLGLVPLMFTNNFLEFSNGNLLAYSRNEGIVDPMSPLPAYILGNTSSAVRMPSIAGGAVNLNSLGGNINAVVNTAYVTANTAGSGGVGLTSQSSLLIGPSSAGTVFQAGSAAGLSVVGTITAPSIQLFPGTNVPSAATSMSAVIPQSPSQATLASALVATFAPIIAFNSGTLVSTDLTPWSKETTVDKQNSSGDRPLIGSINTTGVPAVGMFRGSTFTEESLSALSSVATLKPGGSDNTLVLEAGSVLFAPTAPVTVIVRDVAVDLKPGSVALISVDNDSVAVFNLHDDYPGDVSVSTKKRSLDLMPGQEAVFSKSVSGFEQIGIATQVGFREVQSLDFGEGQVFIADFSILRALQLNSLRAQFSARNSDGKSLFDKILKSAACVHLTRAAHGNYR